MGRRMETDWLAREWETSCSILAARMGTIGLHHTLCTTGMGRGCLYCVVNSLLLFPPYCVPSGLASPYICSPLPSVGLDQLYCLVHILFSYLSWSPIVWAHISLFRLSVEIWFLKIQKKRKRKKINKKKKNIILNQLPLLLCLSFQPTRSLTFTDGFTHINWSEHTCRDAWHLIDRPIA